MWPAPPRNANDDSVQSIRRVDVYRVAEKSNAPLPLTEDQFGARATLIGSVTYDEIKKAGPTLTYVDQLDMGGEPSRLRYAIRYVNAAGQRAAFSNFFLMEPAARVAAAPAITGRELSETANTIKWEAPSKNIDDSTPVNLLGYNVYRRLETQTEPEAKLLNTEPVTATQYSDKQFKFGEKYLYFVRAVSLGSEGKPIESLNSNTLELSQVDLYPPSAPSLAQPGVAPDGLLCSGRRIQNRMWPATFYIALPIQILRKIGGLS